MASEKLNLLEKTLWKQSNDISTIKSEVRNVTKILDKLLEYQKTQIRLEEKCKTIEKDSEDHKSEDKVIHKKQDEKIERIEKNMFRATGALAVVYAVIGYLVNKFL